MPRTPKKRTPQLLDMSDPTRPLHQLNFFRSAIRNGAALLSNAHLVMLFYLLDRTVGWQKLEETLTARRIADDLRLHPQTVRRLVRDLAAFGAISYEPAEDIWKGLNIEVNAAWLAAPSLGEAPDMDDRGGLRKSEGGGRKSDRGIRDSRHPLTVKAQSPRMRKNSEIKEIWA